MKRRDFITQLGGAAAAWPLAARAQQTKVYRIGALLVGNADVVSFRTELREELRKAGYVEGRNLLLAHLWPRLIGRALSRRLISRCTASRIKAVLSSPSARTAAATRGSLLQKCHAPKRSSGPGIGA